MPALPMQLEEKRDKAFQIYADMKRILTDPNATPEEKAQLEAMHAEADDLTSEVFRLEDVETSFGKLKQIAAKERRLEQSEFATHGEFLQAVYKAGKTGQVDPRLVYFEQEKSVENKDMNEGVGAEGGYLVPAEHDNTVLSVGVQGSPFLERATHIPMRRRELSIPMLDQGATTAGTPHWFGGIETYWVAEAAEKPESEPSWGEITLVAHELVGFTRVSNALLADSAVSLDAFFNGPLGFAGALRWRMQYAAIRGTGAGQPEGILNADAALVVDRATSGSVTYPDLLNMLEVFLMTGGQGMWMASQSMLAELAQINGPSGNPSYVWKMDATDGIPGTLLGMPIFFTEMLPPLGTQGDLVLVNPTFYLVGDRQATTIESTPYEKWRFNQTSWRAVARMDGQVWLKDPITLVDGSSQLSPVVLLGDTAT